MATGSERDQALRFLVAIDHLAREQLSGDAKRVGLGHGRSLHHVEGFVYFM